MGIHSPISTKHKQEIEPHGDSSVPRWEWLNVFRVEFLATGHVSKKTALAPVLPQEGPATTKNLEHVLGFEAGCLRIQT